MCIIVFPFLPRLISELEGCCGLLESDQKLLSQFYQDLSTMEVWASDTKELLTMETKAVVGENAALSKAKNQVGSLLVQHNLVPRLLPLEVSAYFRWVEPGDAVRFNMYVYVTYVNSLL